MKLTKSQLQQIIKEELGVIHHRLQLLDGIVSDLPESDGEESDVYGEEEIEEARGEKTPEEVKYYAEKVKGKLPKTDPKTGKPSSPYAVAWKTARQPGSKGGRKVMGRKK